MNPFFCLQESEIVEVLWKQDVDLGYSLAPAKPLDVKKSGVNADDENEKLRALQELKDEKVCVRGLGFAVSYMANCKFEFILKGTRKRKGNR